MEIRQAFRRVASRPLYTSLLVAVIALGIGPTTAMYAMTDAVLFRSLPVPEPERVVRLFRVDDTGRPAGTLNFPIFEDFRERVDAFAAVAAFTFAPFNVAVGDAPPARVPGAAVTGDYFTVFGVPPLQGRPLLPDDDRVRGDHAVAVVSEKFARAAEVAPGATMRINNHEFEVVGVMPARLTDAAGGVDVWTPMAMMESTINQPWDARTNRGRSWHQGVARLRPGVTREHAQAEIDAVAAAVLAEHGGNPRFMRYGIVDASRAAIDTWGSAGTRRSSVLLFGLTVTLMVIALMNAASLVLVRTEERARELALRMGLGAGRARVFRMLATEAAAFAAAGTAVGILLAWAITEAGAPWLRSVVNWQGVDGAVLMHWRVVAFAAAAAALAVLVAVALPAIRVASLDLNAVLKDGAPRERGHGAAVRAGASVVQVALSVALLAVALLLVRSLWNTTAVDPGFAVQGTLVTEIDLMRQGYTADEAARFRDAVVERLEESPLVERAAFTTNLPMSGNSMAASFTVVGEEGGDFRNTDVNAATPGYFEVMRIPLLAGRLFAVGDDAPLEAVVSRSFAQAVFGDAEPIGQSLDTMQRQVAIVGVVGDIKHQSLRGSTAPVVWLPLSGSGQMQPHLVVRARSGDPWSIAPLMHDVISGLDRDAPMFDTRTLAEHVGTSYRSARAMAYLLTAFAMLAVALSASGMFGLLSWQVRTRTREIGIRKALGATAVRIRRHYLGRAVILTVVAVPIGLVAAGWAARALDTWLFGIAAVDALTYATVAAGALAVALLAAWLPAARAANVAPSVALRDL